MPMAHQVEYQVGYNGHEKLWGFTFYMMAIKNLFEPQNSSLMQRILGREESL